MLPILHLKPEDSISVTLQNPIELGARIDNKKFILDLAVVINNVLFLNMEMQVYNEAFWKERSLSYTCRSFDQLNHGETYGNVLPVVDLTKTELATEEDLSHGLDLWTHVFTATTWEEIEVLAQNNEYLKEAVSGVRQLTEDEKIGQQCQAREDFAYWERIHNNRMKELGDNLEQAQDELSQTQEQLNQTLDELNQKRNELDHTQNELNHTQNELSHTQDELAKALARIAELEHRQ